MPSCAHVGRPVHRSGGGEKRKTSPVVISVQYLALPPRCRGAQISIGPRLIPGAGSGSLLQKLPHPGISPGIVPHSAADYRASSTELNCMRAFASAIPTLTDLLQTQTTAWSVFFLQR